MQKEGTLLFYTKASLVKEGAVCYNPKECKEGNTNAHQTG